MIVVHCHYAVLAYIDLGNTAMLHMILKIKEMLKYSTRGRTNIYISTVVNEL